MAQIVNVTDTFSFWREQFNALVGEVGVKKYFKTPQDFGAVGDGSVDDTSAFDVAALQSVPVYIPPGLYRITNNYTGANKFFDFGGVSYVGGGSVVTGFSFNPTGTLQLNKNVLGIDPTIPQHLTTKNYVDGLNSAEASARSLADTTLQNNINTLASNTYTKTEADNKFSYFYKNVRSVGLAPTNNLLIISDNILASDMNGIANYSLSGDGWSNVALPSLSSVIGQEKNTLTITNSSISNSTEIRIVPQSGQGFYPGMSNVFYPNGVITLARGDSVVLIPSTGLGFWWILSINRQSTVANIQDMSLTFSATISGNDGSILRRRGFLGVQVTKQSTGQYKIDWQEESIFGDYPQIYLSNWAQDPNVDVVHQPNGSTSKIVRTFFNGVPYDLTFDLLIAYPTRNSYKPW